MVTRVASRILLVPVIASIAYEFIRLGANHPNNPIMRALLAPGMWMQRLTTGEPDLSQIEVAIVALKRVLVADGVLPAEPPAEAVGELETAPVG